MADILGIFKTYLIIVFNDITKSIDAFFLISKNQPFSLKMPKNG